MVKQGDISAVVVIQGLYRVADIIAIGRTWKIVEIVESNATIHSPRIRRMRVYLIEPNRGKFVSN